MYNISSYMVRPLYYKICHGCGKPLDLRKSWYCLNDKIYCDKNEIQYIENRLTVYKKMKT